MHETMDFDREEHVESEEERDQSRWKKRIPFWVAVVRPFQLIFAFIVLSLTGYVVRVFGGDFAHTFASSFLAFTWTIMLLLYIFITPLRLPKLYNRWVHYCLETLTLVIWVVNFALLVGECQSWDAAEDAVADVLTPEEVAAINSIPGQIGAIKALRAATWLAGSDSVFFFLTLVTCILGHVRT